MTRCQQGRRCMWARVAIEEVKVVCMFPRCICEVVANAGKADEAVLNDRVSCLDKGTVLRSPQATDKAGV
jgi:hypothetical protein